MMLLIEGYLLQIVARKVVNLEKRQPIFADEFQSIFQLRNDCGFNEQLTLEEAMKVYNEISTEAFELMKKKNHDYGEAWRDMRVTSLTDLILTKVLRIKQIEDNKGKTLVSEGIDANYQDMINYAVFALIHLGFHKK
jgi:uncharacterized protein YdiU (UPF0061 family)